MRQIIQKMVGWMIVIVLLILITVQGFTPLGPMDYGVILNPSMSTADIVTEEQILLPKKKLTADEINSIKEYSSEYGIDYRLVMSIIEQESQFDNEALSERGATGLMQLMPMTRVEIAEKLELTDSTVSSGNIKSGIYYFSKLFELFRHTDDEDRLCLALAAYNAGPSRIYDAQEIAAYMGENPGKWISIRKILPLLSKRYYSLHQSIWNDGKPPSGYFGSWRQTVSYVQRTMTIYHNYLKKGI